MNDAPEVFEELLLRSSSRFYQDIPLVPLKVLTISTIDPQVGVEGSHLQGHTKNPRRVLWSWYVSNRRKFPVPSKKGIREDCRASRNRHKLVLHG